MATHTPEKLASMIKQARRKIQGHWAKLKRHVHSIEGLEADVKRWEKAKDAKEKEETFKQALNIDQHPKE